MKKLSILIAFIAFISCEKEPVTVYTIVSGTIKNASTKTISVIDQFDSGKKIEITLADDGTFRDTLNISTSTNIFLLRQDNNFTKFYAPKGSSIHITYNAQKQDSTLQITGDFNSVNNYIIARENSYIEEMGDEKETFLKNEDDFKKHVLKLKSDQEYVLYNHEGLPESFKKKETKDINYNYLESLTNYELYHGYFSKDRSFKASEDYLDELKNISFENEEDFLYSSSYRAIVGRYYRLEATKLIKKDSLLAGDLTYLRSVAPIKSDLIRNKLLFDDATYGITYTDNLEEYYSLFTTASTNVENNKKITDAYNQIKKLAKGSLSPKFTDYENNTGGSMSLDDLKGSYVYFDIWATWCGPCIAEIPSLKKTEKQFHNKNIKFVSISIDTEDAYDKWKNMIVDKKLGGVQLLADNNWKSQFIEDYLIKGIPRFILIDPQGKIINANASRPSDSKLLQTLNDLDL